MKTVAAQLNQVSHAPLNIRLLSSQRIFSRFLLAFLQLFCSFSVAFLSFSVVIFSFSVLQKTFSVVRHKFCIEYSVVFCSLVNLLQFQKTTEIEIFCSTENFDPFFVVNLYIFCTTEYFLQYRNALRSSFLYYRKRQNIFCSISVIIEPITIPYLQSDHTYFLNLNLLFQK